MNPPGHEEGIKKIKHLYDAMVKDFQGDFYLMLNVS